MPLTKMRINGKKSNHEVYTQLTDRDALYLSQLSLLRSPESMVPIGLLLRQFSFLLFLTVKAFFGRVEQAQFRVSLESCLANFPRKHYAKGTPLQLEMNEELEKYEHIMKVVLTVLLRISQAPPEHVHTVYNEWLLDIPKLLDIAAIYGAANPSVVRRIILNALERNNAFNADICDFLSILENNWLPRIQNLFQDSVDLTTARSKSTMKAVALKSLLALNETLIALNNFARFFPDESSRMYTCDCQLVERILTIVSRVTGLVQEQWQLESAEELFSAVLQDIWSHSAENLSLIFEGIVKGYSCGDENARIGAEQTYGLLALLRLTQEKRVQKYYEKLLQTLIQQSQQSLFCVAPNNLLQLSKQFRKSVAAAIKFECLYRIQVKKEKKSGILRAEVAFLLAQRPILQKQPPEPSYLSKYLTMTRDIRTVYHREYDDEPDHINEFLRVRPQEEEEEEGSGGKSTAIYVPKCKQGSIESKSILDINTISDEMHETMEIINTEQQQPQKATILSELFLANPEAQIQLLQHQDESDLSFEDD